MISAAVRDEALLVLDRRGMILDSAREVSSLMRQTGVNGAVIDGVTTVSLADLIDMKLRSGASNPLRAQDLADSIGLIRHHRLRNDFASRLGADVRSEFRKLVEAIDRS